MLREFGFMGLALWAASGSAQTLHAAPSAEGTPHGEPKPDSLAAAAATASQDAARRARLTACLKHVTGASRPEYPDEFQRRGAQARVFVEQTFTSPDTAPVVQVYVRPALREFGYEIEHWSKGLRLPGYDGQPATLTAVYVYRFEGGHFGFKPLRLDELLQFARG